jgi:hypothetical protein
MPAAAPPARVAASSTLGSPSIRAPAVSPAQAAPPIVVLAPASGDLESRTFRGKTGIAAGLVVALVLGALVAGFALGFAAARL